MVKEKENGEQGSSPPAWSLRSLESSPAGSSRLHGELISLGELARKELARRSGWGPRHGARACIGGRLLTLLMKTCGNGSEHPRGRRRNNGGLLIVFEKAHPNSNEGKIRIRVAAVQPASDIFASIGCKYGNITILFLLFF